jgi:hypothetical protein
MPPRVRLTQKGKCKEASRLIGNSTIAWTSQRLMKIMRAKRKGIGLLKLEFEAKV